MDNKALYNLSYGLYLLTAREDGRDNGCIINTAIQAASDPVRIAISAIQSNLTREMIERTGAFNLSALTVSTPFEVFKRFGMQSGRNIDKFTGFDMTARSENGLLYLTEHVNTLLSVCVTEAHPLGSHTLFIGELRDAHVLSDTSSCTYAYYQSKIKPRPAAAEPTVVGWRCTICGYVYKDAKLPKDFSCPRCGHGTEDFEPLYTLE